MPARAKLNLDLAVLGRTKDGLHEVRTHIQAVALHDLLELTRADRTTMTTSRPASARSRHQLGSESP